MRKATWLAASAAGLLVIGALAPSARADLKLEQTVSVSGLVKPGETKSKTISSKSTLYYKGSRHRVDTNNGATIFDTATGKVFVLNPSDKTYYETTIADVESGGGAGIESIIDFNGDAVVVDTQEEKKIGGKTAHHYQCTISMKFKPKAGAPPTIGAFLPLSRDLKIDQWTVDSADAPTAQKIQTANTVQFLGIGTEAPLKPFAAKLAAIKGVPVDVTQTISIVQNPSAPDEYKAQQQNEPIIIKNATATLSEDVLSESLFAVPPGYKKIDAPKAAVPNQ